MTDVSYPSAAHASQPDRQALRTAMIQAAVLIGLWFAFFLPEILTIWQAARQSGDRAHALALPVAILILAWRRRKLLSAALTRGSRWGIVLIGLGLVAYAATTWPLDFQYVRDLSMVPVLAGVVLAAGGWRVLAHSVPIILLVLLAVPIGQRYYARLIIAPETYTLSATRLVLDQLPGVSVKLEGPDFTYVRGETTGTIALGEPRRGFTLVIACAAVGVFVVFMRVRPFWQLVMLAIGGVPILLLTNFLRVFAWGIATIYSGASAVSTFPRSVAAATAFVSTYVVFVLACGFLDLFVGEEDENGKDSPPVATSR